MKKRLIILTLSVMFIFSLFPFSGFATYVVNRGTCGVNVSWTLDNEGVLLITGQGDMDTGDSLGEGSPFYRREDIKKVIIDNGVTSIGNGAFFDCPRLSVVSIPGSIRTIGERAFYACARLESIALPENLQQIETGAFMGCSSLAEVMLPERIFVVEDQVFYNCTSLSKVTLPPSITHIGKSAFHWCNSLQQIEIPAAVKTIGREAFIGSGLTELHLKNKSVSIEVDALKYCNDLKDILFAGSESDWIKNGNHESVDNRDIRIHYNVKDFSTHLQIIEIEEPSCVQSGYSVFNCSCGYQNEICRATYDWDNHTWDSGRITRQPTTLLEGEIVFTCKLCGKTRTDSIPKLNPEQAFNPFTNVKSGAYYYDPVLWAVNHTPQITNGTSPTTFSPDATCTRGQVVTFLWRAMNCPEPKSASNPFTDVKPGDYFYKAVLWAAENGITTGTSKTAFSPNQPCTRAHVVTFLWRTHEKPAAGSNNPFTDVPGGQYYTDAVLWAVDQKITNGTSGTTFSPGNPCTRGQIVTFLYRDLKK